MLAGCVLRHRRYLRPTAQTRLMQMLRGRELPSPGKIRIAARGERTHGRHPEKVSSFPKRFPAKSFPLPPLDVLFSKSREVSLLHEILRQCCRLSKTPRNTKSALQYCFLTSRRKTEAVTTSGNSNKLHWYQARDVETSPPPKGGSNLTWQVSPPLH